MKTIHLYKVQRQFSHLYAKDGWLPFEMRHEEDVLSAHRNLWCSQCDNSLSSPLVICTLFYCMSKFNFKMLLKVPALVALHLENRLEKNMQNKTDKELISIIYKKLLDSDKEKTKSPREKYSKSMIRQLRKLEVKMASKPMKICLSPEVIWN